MSAPSRLHSVAIVLLVALLMVPVLSLPGDAIDAETSASYHYHFDRTVVDMSSARRSFLVDDLELDVTPGAPALPLESIRLAVPPGQRLVDVEVSHARPKLVELVESYPHNSAEVPIGGEELVAQDTDLGAWTFTGSYEMEGVEVACIDLRPLCWDASTGRVDLVTDYSVTLRTEPDEPGFIGDLDRVRELVNNPDEVPDMARTIVSNVLPSGSYEHLIITDVSLTAPFQALVDWKVGRNDQGSIQSNIASIVVDLQHIRSYSQLWGVPTSHGGTGNDTQTLVRNFIRAAYQEWGVTYVLLGGDDDVLPCRMLWVSEVGGIEEVPGDIYFSGLDGDWDDDMDGTYGEPQGEGIRGEETDPLAEVFVGRATVSNVREAWNFVNKTIQYEKGYVGQYQDDILLVGELLNSDPLTWGGDYKDRVYNEVLKDEGLDRTTIYERDGTFSKSIFLEQMESDVHLINHMGHGNYEAFADLSISDVRGLQNDLPFILYTQACMAAGFDEKPDDPGDCIAEEFIKGEGGAVAFIGNSRYGWYSPGNTDGSSEKFDISFFSQVFDDDVTHLGEALSRSKEEWVNYVTTTDTMRWVYMELNLLGDPETKVLTDSHGDHDLTAKRIVADRCVLNEQCQVTVQVQNLGQFLETGVVRLLADEVLVSSSPVSLIPGETAWVELNWTPIEYRPYGLRAEVSISNDDDMTNDHADLTALVDRRITQDELWDQEHLILPGGVIVDPGVTLEVRNSTVDFSPQGFEYALEVRGTLLANGTAFGGSPFRFLSSGELELVDCQLTGLSEERGSLIDGGGLSLSNTSILGGMGWRINGTDLHIDGSRLVDQTSEWSVSRSLVDVDGSNGTGGFGLRLSNVSGALRNLTWSGGLRGLTVEWSSGLLLHDILLSGNQVDVELSGNVSAHFLHDARNVNLTSGRLVVVEEVNDTILEGGIGSLYLVDCHDVTVRGWSLRNGGKGLGLISSTGITVIGNAMENCSTGLFALDSDGVVWSNDLIENQRQVRQVRSNLTFGLAYPIGGNHWSDLIGVDVKNGPEQDRSGPDGVADQAYLGDEVMDRYPKVGRCSIVHDVPVADFTMDTEALDILRAVTFTDRSASGSGISNWTWDLGDGTLIYGRQVSHLYSVKGLVTISLTVTDHKGLTDQISLDAEVMNHRPECDFSYSPSQPAPDGNISFQDLSQDIDGGIASWYWDLGDGTSTSSTSFTHSFSVEGDYLVSLTVTDAEGESSSRVRKVPVGNQAPLAGFSWSPSSITSLQSVNFFSNSTDTDGRIEAWTWNFGDGTTGNGSSVVHRFAKTGTYLVRLTVTDDDGATGTISRSLVVNNARPTAAFEGTEQVMSMVAVQFKDRSFDPDGSIRSWSWDFGDGTGSNVASPSHAYAGPGEYAVTLTVQDNQGSAGSCTKSVTVMNRPPQASIIIPDGDHHSLDQVELVGIGSDVDGNVTVYQWDLGDGGGAEGEMVRHAYEAPGTYTVTLTLVDDAGGRSSASTAILILNLAPEASILVEQGPDHPRERTFIAEAVDRDGRVEGYNWSFGDGSYGSEETCLHRYAGDGEYLVELTVIDDQGGRKNVTLTINVWTGDLSLENATCVQREEGWAFTAELVNDGTIPVDVVLKLNVSGSETSAPYRLEAGERRMVEISLGDIEEGAVTATLVLPEGWGQVTGDTTWTGSVVKNDEGLPWMLITAMLLLAVAAIAVTVVLLRRR